MRPWLAGAALLLLVLVAYYPLRSAGYIWDDDYYVVKNLALRSAGGLWAIWSHPLHPVTPQYYPFTFTTFWVEYHLWGDRPLGFHIVNVVLHSLSAIVLWRLLRKLEIRGAWLAATVFALHPVHVESVAWVSERKNVLSGLLYLMSLACYLRWIGVIKPAGERRSVQDAHVERRTSLWYAMALGLFILAIFSKTVTSSLPAVVLLILYWKRGRISRRDVTPLVPFFAFGLTLGSITSWLEKHHVGAQGPEWSFTLLQRIGIAGRDIWFYAGKLLWPSHLNFVYPRWDVSHVAIGVFAAAAAIAVVAGLWFARHRIGRGPLVAVLFFGGSLFPALGFVDLYPMRFSFVADHFQYLASIGLIVLVIGGAASLLRRAALDEGGFISTALGGTLVILLLVSTFIRTAPFRSETLLWSDVIQKNPQAWLAYDSLAAEALRNADYAGARKNAEAALAIRPDYTYCRLIVLVADLATRTGRFGDRRLDQAVIIQKARTALESASGTDSFVDRIQRANSWKMLATVLIALHNDQAAEDALQHLLALEPSDQETRRDLARALEHRHDLTGALAQWSQLIQQDPLNAQAHAHSALLLSQTGSIESAAKELALAQKLDSRYSTYTLSTPLHY